MSHPDLGAIPVTSPMSTAAGRRPGETDMKQPYRMTALAAAMAVVALGTACEEQKTPEEKVQEQIQQPAQGSDTASPSQSEDTTE